MLSFAAILAGGENTRIGRPKALLEIGGKPMIQRTLDLLGGRFMRVAVSTNSPEEYFRFGAPLVGDVYNVRCPMSGIFSALYWSGAEEAFITACDMPFISPAVMDMLIARYTELKREKGRRRGALVPRWNGLPEPLLAIYSSECLPAMEAHILSGRTGIPELLEEVGAAYLDEVEIRKVDPDGASFFNVNTPQDIQNALAYQDAMIKQAN
ncbi:MAG: molybdenum cofactor guanylyltransferase [Nitrospiraceae bacterium]|nr:molybdenum cofactor guanylyltransferase [Nitrospiraceae bacterium]